jgi:hypothetical protein
MTTEKTNQAIDGRAWPTQISETARPLCPQFRPCPMEALAPVGGHCLLSRSPGWFMIPTLVTYDRYCTRVGFAACDWFDAGGELTGGGTDAPPHAAQPGRRVAASTDDEKITLGTR